MPDVDLHSADNDLCHLVRFAAMLCVTNIIVPAFIYIQEEFPVKTLFLWDVAPSRFLVATDVSTFRRRILPLLLGSSSRGRGLFDTEDKDTTVV